MSSNATTIYGYSDDVVGIESSQDGKKRVHEELDCFETIVELTFGDAEAGGCRVVMTYGRKQAVWTASVEQLEEDVHIPWPVAIRTEEEHPYSVIVELGEGAVLTGAIGFCETTGAETRRWTVVDGVFQ